MLFYFVYRQEISSVFLIKVAFVWGYDHDASSVVVDPARVLFLVNSYVLLFSFTSPYIIMLKNELFIYSFFKFWRWFPIGDHFVDVFLSRDTDSQIFQREVDAVKFWLYENKIAHIMRGK